MPTYDYVCDACSHAFEHRQSMSSNRLRTCPKCKQRKLRRLIGSGAGVIFKGSGFYETDYKRKPGDKGGDKNGGTSKASESSEQSSSSEKSTPTPTPSKSDDRSCSPSDARRDSSNTKADNPKKKDS